MSRKELIICDECKKEFPKHNDFYTVSHSYNRYMDTIVKSFDLCKECGDRLKLPANLDLV